MAGCRSIPCPSFFQLTLAPSPSFSFLLPSIGVGQVVKGLRKHAEADIQAKAKAAFTRWKENFKQDAQPAAPGPAAATDGEAEKKKKKKVKTDAKDETPAPVASTDAKDEAPAPAASSAPEPVPPPPQEKAAEASGEEDGRCVNP